MKYKYKSTRIDFTKGIKVSNLCVFNDYYYFESDELVEESIQITEEEFEQAISSIVHATPEPVPSQLDRIESMVAKSQEEIAQEARDAYTLELIEGGVIA